MGHDLSEESATKLVQGMIPDADKVEPIANTSQLLRMREVVDNTLMPEAEAKRVVRAVKAIKKELYDQHGIVEADRMAVQLGKTARTLGLFNGREVRTDDVNTAIRLVLGARIGALVAGDSFDALRKMTDSVLAQSS